MSEVVNRERISSLIRELIAEIGDDPNREALKLTPSRVAESYSTLFSGYTESLGEIIGNGIFEDPSSDLVIVKDIQVYSICEHHLLPFFGTAHVGYIPNGRILGLSKIAKVVEHYSRKLQIQEQLTAEIADGLIEAVNAKGAICVIEAQHMCSMMRNECQPGNTLVTTATRGIFADCSSTREQFFNLL